MEEQIEFNPEKNEKVISIIKQEDGNWIGYMKKFGKLVKVRDIDPETIVVRLLTHSGKE